MIRRRFGAYHRQSAIAATSEINHSTYDIWKLVLPLRKGLRIDKLVRIRFMPTI